MKKNSPEHQLFLKFIGMRTIKTVIAVFICLLISYYRGTDPLNSVFAAIICMKTNHRIGFDTGIDRIIGTLIGGIYGYLTILLANFLYIDILGLLYYAMISIILIPVIYTTIYLNTPDSVSISAVVFFSVTVSMALTGDVEPLIFVVERVLETLIGIVVSIGVNRFIGNKKSIS